MTRWIAGSTDELPPGSYTNFEALAETQVNAPLEGTVALPFTANWGPENTVVPLLNVSKYRAIFGLDTDTPGYRAALQLFKGEGIENRGGAALMLGYRMVGKTGKAAAAKLKDTSEPAKNEALVLTAKYKGTKGNDLGWKVIVNAKDNTKNDLIIFDGTQEIERYSHVIAEIKKLAEAINKRSNWVTANPKEAVEGKGLALTANIAAFTEGNDGATLEGSDWTTAMDELGKQAFSIFVPFDLTDETIITSLKTWCLNLNETKNKRFTVLVGGKETETIDEAIERSEELNNENICNFGVGSYTDADIIDPATNDLLKLSSSQLAPRIAGIIAAAGESQAITFSRLRGVTVVSGPTDDAIVAGLSAGVITLGVDSNTTAPTRITKGITTYTGDTSEKPLKFYGILKFVRTMQGFENDLQAMWTNGIIGKFGVTPATRETVVGKGKELLKARVDAGAVQDTLLNGEKGWFVRIASVPAPSDTDDFIAIEYGMAFERALEKVLNKVIIS